MIEPGTKFARLTVLSKDEAASAAGRGYHYNCLCSCGARVVVRGSNLTAGQQKSCGCLRRERARIKALASNTKRSAFRLQFEDDDDI